MIEYKNIPTDYKSEEENEDEEDLVLLDIEPGMICLMHCDYKSTEIVPGRLAVLKEGTPVKIREVLLEEKTVIAEDYLGNLWKFKEKEDISDVDFWFDPLAKENVDALRDEKKVKRHARLHQWVEGKEVSSMVCFPIGSLAALAPVFCGAFTTPIIIGMVAGVAMLGYSIANYIIANWCCDNWLTDSALAFVDEYSQNMRELQTLLNTPHIFYASEE